MIVEGKGVEVIHFAHHFIGFLVQQQLLLQKLQLENSLVQLLLLVYGVLRRILRQLLQLVQSLVEVEKVKAFGTNTADIVVIFDSGRGETRGIC